MEGKVRQNHPGKIRLETAEAKADRLIAEELARLQWTLDDLAAHRKSHPSKLALGARRSIATRDDPFSQTDRRAVALGEAGRGKGKSASLAEAAHRRQPPNPNVNLMNEEHYYAFLQSDPVDGEP